MSRFSWTGGPRRNHQQTERGAPNRLRIAMGTVGPIAVLAIGLLNMRLEKSRADDKPPSGTTSPSSRFVVDSRARLAQLQANLADLGSQALAGIETTGPSEGDVAVQKLQVEAAKAAHQRAQLARDAAEIALKEYQDGVFPQEKKTCEAELEMARAELESADRAVQEAGQRYAKFKQVKTGSAADLARGWRLEAGETGARLVRKKTQFVLEQAQSKRKVLVTYEYEHNLLNLRSAIEKARSNELAQRASGDLEQAKLKKLEGLRDPTRNRKSLSDDRKQLLQALARAIPLEERLSSRLGQIQEDRLPAESLRKEVTDLIRELQDIVDRAHDAETAAAMRKLSSGLSRAMAR